MYMNDGDIVLCPLCDRPALEGTLPYAEEWQIPMCLRCENSSTTEGLAGSAAARVIARCKELGLPAPKRNDRGFVCLPVRIVEIREAH